LEPLIVNIAFNNTFAKKAGLLYLYYKLRLYSSTRGGSIVGFKFTRSERYGNFKELKKLGWVTEDRFISYRKTVSKYTFLTISTKITENDLAKLNNFKGFLIAATESYVLHRNNKIQSGRAKKIRNGEFINRDWDKMGNTQNEKFWLKTKKIAVDEEPGIIGRVYTGMIAEMMGISLRTITRWRNSSPNKYKTVWYRPENVPFSGRNQEMYFKAGTKYYTVDQTIVSTVPVFANSKLSVPHSITSQKM